MATGIAMALLEIRDLQRSFDAVVALDGLALEVAAGTVTGLIGPNGAGKTTLFNVVSGLVPPSAGSIRFAGADITGWRPDRIARTGLVRTFQIARGLLRLTVLENLMLYGDGQPGEVLWQALVRPAAVARHEAALAERAWAMVERLELERVADQPALELSGGQKKLLELGRALMAHPKLVLLDEPAAGVNPSLAKRLAEHILACRAEGISFLVIEHNMGIVAELCDPVIVMAAGQRLAEGRFEAIRSDPRVQAAYMGSRP
ncbi:MAG: ABC transporter ATP-binding protein [Alphaproteobacteria bacterium]